MANCRLTRYDEQQTEEHERTKVVNGLSLYGKR